MKPRDTAFPDMEGFSPRNLKHKRSFAQAWPDTGFMQEVLAQLLWHHQITAINQYRVTCPPGFNSAKAFIVPDLVLLVMAFRWWWSARARPSRAPGFGGRPATALQEPAQGRLEVDDNEGNEALLATNHLLDVVQHFMLLMQAGAREHFIRWYSERARIWLSSRVAEYQSRMEVSPACVKVQDLGYRWGSCGKGEWLYFHWKTILLPTRIAEYVVVHEIAHLHEPHHTPAFWLRVERAMPDYSQRKAWLAEHGIDVEGM